MRYLLLLSTIFAFSAGPTFARSSKRLWSEKPQSAPALAEVPDFAALAKKLMPAVVGIQVEQKVQQSRSGRRGNHPFYDLFREFGGPQAQPGKGLGTGFVIHKDGLIVTNNHVIQDADRIEVSFWGADGNEEKMEAKLVGTAPNYDVALIKTVKKANATVAYLGDSDDSHIGDWVMAIGTPFGLSHSVSVGIVSQKERRDIRPSGSAGIFDFIQTDAAINPGNSGGPLINMKGEVIGVNTAINAQGTGIGFAIPINMVKSMVPDLESKGRFVRSWLGISMEPNFSNALAKTFGMKQARGALVAGVIENSPASKAGIRENDIILSFDGKSLRDAEALRLNAGMAGVGARVPVKVLRNGKEIRVDVLMEAFDESATVAAAPQSRGVPGALGLTVEDITAEHRRFGIRAQSGVVITQVSPNGLAAREGLQAGDVLLSLNGRSVKSANGFVTAVKKIKSGQAFRLKVLSRNRGTYLLGIIKP